MINFSINKNLFLQALNTTKRAISHKNAIPILSTVKIDVTSEGITLIGSNGQISIENFISIKNENAGLLITSSGSILLEATFFINVVSSLPDIIFDFKEITIDVAAEAIRARKQDANQMLVIPIDKIQTEVGNFYGVSVKEMKGSRRVQNIVLARQVAMYLTRELTDNSLPKIGREFGGKDHTTVIHAHGKIKTMLETDDNLRLEIENIKNKIR